MTAVRRGTMADLAAVVALEKCLERAPHWPEDAYSRALRGGAHGLFVVERDGEIAGFAVGQVILDAGELESVAVRERDGRRGFGTALVKAVVAWAAAEGAQTVRLEVRAGSAGARRLYRGVGFREVGVRPGYYSAPQEDAILMQWEAADRAAEECGGEV